MAQKVDLSALKILNLPGCPFCPTPIERQHWQFKVGMIFESYCKNCGFAVTYEYGKEKFTDAEKYNQQFILTKFINRWCFRGDVKIVDRDVIVDKYKIHQQKQSNIDFG